MKRTHRGAVDRGCQGKAVAATPSDRPGATLDLGSTGKDEYKAFRIIHHVLIFVGRT